MPFIRHIRRFFLERRMLCCYRCIFVQSPFYISVSLTISYFSLPPYWLDRLPDRSRQSGWFGRINSWGGGIDDEKKNSTCRYSKGVNFHRKCFGMFMIQRGACSVVLGLYKEPGRRFKGMTVWGAALYLRDVSWSTKTTLKLGLSLVRRRGGEYFIYGEWFQNRKEGSLTAAHSLAASIRKDTWDWETMNSLRAGSR